MEHPTLGLDIGGSAVKWAVLGSDDSVLETGSAPTPQTGCADVVELLAALTRGTTNPVGSVAAVIPGHVDRTTGTVALLPNVPGDWRGFPLGAALADRIGRPVAVLNDARAFARAELQLGAGRGRRHVLFATLGTGVGGAVAIDGRLLTNADDGVGEVGHIVVEPDGVPCGCGAVGCLETVASATALVSAAARAVLLGLSPALQAGTAGRLDRLTPAMVSDAARGGDDYCATLLARAGLALGLAVRSACSFLALDTVVVGGGAAGAIDQLLPHVRRMLGARPSIFPDISVRRAALGPTAGALGAALCAREAPPLLREELNVALDH